MTDVALPIDVPMAEIADHCRRYRIREFSGFGSARLDDFGPGSDVDLLVEFEPDARVGFLLIGRIERELGALFGWKVGLIPKRGLGPPIRGSVLEPARELYVA